MSLDNIIITSTSEIFDTMIMMEVSAGEVITDKNFSIPSNVTGALGLAGGFKGALAVHCPAEAAKAITGSFLGMEVGEIDEDVKDAVGELVNMIAGGIKAALLHDGLDLQLSVPTAVTGKSFRIAGMSGAERLIVPFSIAHGPFWVELKYVMPR